MPHLPRAVPLLERRGHGTSANVTSSEHQSPAPAVSCSPLALTPHFTYSPPARGSAHRAPRQAQQSHGHCSSSEVRKCSQAQQPLAPHPAPRGCFLELCPHTGLAWSTTAPSAGTARGTRASASEKCPGLGQSPGKPHVWRIVLRAAAASTINPANLPEFRPFPSLAAESKGQSLTPG